MSFSWIPSGATPEFFNFHFWRKMKASHQQWETLDFSCKSITEQNPDNPAKKPVVTDILSMPHMEAIFDNGARKCQRDRTSEGYELIRVGPFNHPDTALNPHLDWVMASAHYLKPSNGNHAKQVGLRLIADSGGAQIKFRTANYVDPHHVIEAYNACADYGMALDIPPRPGVDASNQKALKILARIQKKNNELFLAKRRPDLGLLNVAHGTRSDDFRLWIDTVNDKDPNSFQGWAIGLDSDIPSVFRGAAILYREYGMKESSQWLHLFGVSGPVQIPAMAWLGRYIPLLTADSSSYLEGCRRRTYFQNHGGKIHALALGTGKFCNFENTEFSSSSMLPCSCEFCSHMKYFGAFTSQDFDSSFSMIIAHNLVTIKQVAAQWNTLAQQMDIKSYAKLVKRRVGATAAILCEYVEACIVDGPEYASRTFNQFLNGSGSMYQGSIEERVSRQMTRVPIFMVGSKKSDEINGLGAPGSNLEVIGNYMNDEELLATYREFGFTAAEQELVNKTKAEKKEVTAETDHSSPVMNEDGEIQEFETSEVAVPEVPVNGKAVVPVASEA